MKVAIDIRPTKNGHSVRGIGAYTQNLIDEFKKGKYKNIEFEFFENPASPPPVDIIHYPYFDLFFHTLPIKKVTSRVVTIHDVIPLVFPEHFPVGIRGNINFFFQKLALKNVDAIICDSKTSKADIADKLSFPPQKIHVVYLAASDKFHPINDSSVLSVVANKYKLPKKFALYLGDVNWNKNIPNLLKAIRRCDANLVMVGKALADESLPEVKKIKELIVRLNLGNRIIKTGYIDEGDLVHIYNLAEVTVLPSFYEGFGLPVIESMACGTPAVCSKVASLAEIGDATAIFCDPDDSKDIATKLSYVFSLDKKSKEKLKNKCMKQATKFDWQKTAMSTVRVYKSLHGN